MINQKEYIQKGKGDTIILLHGLFGALSNWHNVLTFLSKNYKVIIPLIPITKIDIKKTKLIDIINLRFFINKTIKTHPNKNKIIGILFPDNRVATR